MAVPFLVAASERVNTITPVVIKVRWPREKSGVLFETSLPMICAKIDIDEKVDKIKQNNIKIIAHGKTHCFCSNPL